MPVPARGPQHVLLPCVDSVTGSSPDQPQVLWCVHIISASRVNNVIFHCLLLKMHRKRLKPEKHGKIIYVGGMNFPSCQTPARIYHGALQFGSLSNILKVCLCYSQRHREAEGYWEEWELLLVLEQERGKHNVKAPERLPPLNMENKGQ